MKNDLPIHEVQSKGIEFANRVHFGRGPAQFFLVFLVYFQVEVFSLDGKMAPNTVLFLHVGKCPIVPKCNLLIIRDPGSPS